MEISLDCGDLLLLFFFLAKGCAKWFEEERLACSFVVKVWFEVGQVGL